MRRVGLSAATKSSAAKARTAEIAEELATQRAAHIEEQVRTFKGALEDFAARHRADIARDPEFRAHFLKLAKSIGVDPLASSKSVWASTLGVGSFYFDLAVAAAGVCIASRPIDGGLLSLRELTARLRRARGAAAGAISEDDVSRAISKLAVLGGGFAEVTLAGARYVRSVADELDTDGAAVLSLAAVGDGGAGGAVVRDSGDGVGASASGAAAVPTSALSPRGKGWVTAADVCKGCGWPSDRAARAIDSLVADGLAWVDAQGDARALPRFYLPSVGGGAMVGGVGPL